jgi:rhodanese-related sulfurtransferase
MNAAAQLGLIALVSLAAAAGTWLVKPPAPKPNAFACDPSKLNEDEICLADVEGNVLWVDARSRAEWQQNGLEGSILWNLDPKEDANEMEAGAVMRIATGVEQVVVYCSSQACDTSRQIADRIRALDLDPPVKTLHGGWDALKGLGHNPLRGSSPGP